jgi:two-component system, response regulator YesN
MMFEISMEGHAMPRFLMRLLMFSFILGAIPVISIGSISYYMASEDIENNVQNSNAQVLLQTQMRVEQVLKTLELSVIQYVNSPSVSESLSDDLTTNDFGKIRDLSLGLYNLQTFVGVGQAYLIHPQNNWFIGFSQYRTFHDHPDAGSIMGYVNHPRSLFWETRPFPIRTVPSESDTIIPTDNERRLIRLVCKIPVYRTTFEPTELLIVEIHYDELRSLLSQNNSWGTTYILDQDGFDFLTSSDNDYPNLTQEVFEHVKRSGQKDGIVNAKADGKPVLVNYRVADYNDWIYYSVLPIAQVAEQSRNIAVVTLLICLGIFTIVFVVAWIGTRRMYSPIRKLFEFTKAIDPDSSSVPKKDEIRFIEDQLRMLDSTGKQLKEQVRGQFDHLKEFFVLKLFTGQISERDFVYRTRMYGFPAEWSRLAVLTVQIDTLQNTRYREHDKELLLFAINNMIGELLPPSHRFSPILLDQSQVTLLTSDLEDAQELKDWLHASAETIRCKVNEYLQLPISIGISRSFLHIADAVRAYGETLEALRCRISLGPELILHYEDIGQNQENSSAVFSQLKVLEDQIINALKLVDHDRVKRLFHEYMDSIIEKDIPSSELPMLMVQLIVRVFQLLQELGVPIRKVLGEQATVEHFLKLHSMNEIKLWFEAVLLDPIVHYLNERSERQYVNIANQMARMVQESYHRDISLESCAEALSFHPAYLSRVFKKEMGINFIEYLTEYRMSIAKQYLQDSSLKISDIAEKVNYSNQTAFTRSFRKVVGMTPGQYRDMHLKS